MKLLCLLVIWAASLQAAVVRGTVVENRTGNPLSRTAVVLHPLPGTPGTLMAVRTDRFGGFVFAGVPAGSYLLQASRAGFVPVEYGQRRWNSAGLPILLEEAASAFLNLRMLRWGGITGTVRDENGVGRQDFDVLIYRDTQPPQLAASGRTDDRGMFRVGGLLPGNYMVRTGPREDDGAGHLPTFAAETARADEARLFPVLLDEDTREGNLRPLPGRLFSVSGVVTTVPDGLPVTITLSSEMGRQTLQGPAFQFRGLAPGQFEILAEAGPDDESKAKYQAVYSAFSLVDKNIEGMRLVTREVAPTRIDLTPSSVAPADLTAVRVDLAGDGEPLKVQVKPGATALLAPGRWKLLLTPPAGYYVADFSGLFAGRLPRPRVDGWNEILVRDYPSVRFTLSGSPAALHGVVKFGGAASAGAPVFLEGYDPVGRKRIGPLRSARTDGSGHYRFEGLAPGAYRVLATFEFRSPTTAEMEQGGAQSVLLEARKEVTKDLELYGIR